MGDHLDSDGGFTMSDAKKAANIFERTAKLAAGLAEGMPGAPGRGLRIASGIASTVAGLIHALGIDDAQKVIEELVARRDVGVITSGDVVADDASIAGSVEALFNVDGNPPSKASSKSSKSTKT